MPGTLYACHGIFIWNIETQFVSRSVTGSWGLVESAHLEHFLPQFATCSVKESWGLVESAHLEH